MGIRVRCGKGHLLNVKKKYAGKEGRCPKCRALVRVPKLSDDEILDVLMEPDDRPPSSRVEPAKFDTASLHDAPPEAAPDDSTGSSIHDDLPKQDETASMSLMGVSAVRQKKPCACGNSDPVWFASCSKCGTMYPE